MSTVDKQKPALFTEAQKEELIAAMNEDLCSTDIEKINTMEAVLCKQLVAATRETTSILADKLGKRIAKFLFGE